MLKKEVSEVQDNPAANINETVSGPTEEQKEETQLTASYSTEKPFSIQQGDNPTLFEVTTSPVPQGKLVIKLPPFFELTVTPTATENYTVKTSKETFDSSYLEWGSVLEGVERQVIELTYKEVDSNVYATFEMKMTYSSRTALTEAMIRAGKNPDKIPLNLETYLYDTDGELLKQDIVENTSELTDPQTMKMGDTAIDEFKKTDSTLKYENVDVAKKNKNVLYQENKDDYLLRISGYHYPYTNVELLVPKDNENKLITFNTAEKYNRYSWNGEAKEEVIEGQTYLVRSMDDRNVGLSSGYVGPIFRSYNSNGSSVASPMTYIRLEFSNDIKIGNTVSFTSPVLLRYTYKGKIITKELYTLSNYTFQGTVDLRLSLDDNRTVLCGAEFTNGSNRVMNYDEDTGNNPNRKLPIKREDITYTIEYPFETQPKQITTLKTDTLSNFTIVYTVKSKDGTEDVTVENASTGYEFQLSEGERVSKIVIQIPYLDKKEDLTFSVKMQSMETQENGAAILDDKTVYLTHILAVTGEKPITKKSKVNLKARKDLMNSDGRTYEVFLDGTGGSSWTGGMMQIDSRADEHNEYSVTYQNAEFVLNTDPQVMSKITGYWFDFNKAMDEPVTIWYKTNYSQTVWKQISQNNPAATEYYVYLPLESGEYVTEIKLNFSDLSPKEIETPYSYAISFAPILNSKRTYYDSNGQEQSIGFNATFTMKYILGTDNIQKPVVNEETNKVPGTTYLSNVEFPLTPQNASWSSSQTTAYRGSTVEFTINKLVSGGEKYYPGYFGDSDHYYKIDGSLQFTNQYLYIEVDKGFEISSLNISNVFLARENLSNGNRLFVYKITDKTTLAVQDLRVKLYIRPDAETGNTVNPFKSIAISYDQYLKDYFPAYPDVEEQKNQYPYHYVTLRNKNYNNKDYNQFPGGWNVSNEIQKDGFCYPFSEKKFQINEVSTAVTTLFPTLQEGLRDNPLVFKEAQREQLGYVAFIGASSETTVNDYTTTFELPRRGEIQTIDEQTYTSQYALFAAGELEIYLNNRPVDLTAEGITVTYYDGNGQELDVSSFSVQDAKKVEISFDQLVSGNVYELRMPLRADSRTGNDVSAWNAYVINSNHTGDQSINYLPPLTYRYDSYRLIGQFGLDKKEDGTGSVLNETHTLYIFDASWNVVYQQNLTSADSYSYDVQFNSVDSETFYIGFGIDQEKMEEYYPTLHRTISDLPDSEQNIKSLEDGTKFWYLKIEEADLINSTGANKYDALFVHLPTIDAKDLTVMVDETKNLDYEITQTVNSDMVGQYTVRATLNNGASSEVIATLDGTTVTGKMEGTVEYQITVTNKQGKTVSDNAMIKVAPRSGVLQIQKEVEPATASGQFSFRIESEGSPKQVWYMHVQGADFATLDGKTNELILPAGQYTITELDGLNFDLNQTTAKINDLDQGNKRAVTVKITGAEKTRVCFANKVTSSNIPNDSSAVVNGMKQAVITDDYTLYFEQKKELGEDTPSNTTSN